MLASSSPQHHRHPQINKFYFSACYYLARWSYHNLKLNGLWPGLHLKGKRDLRYQPLLAKASGSASRHVASGAAVADLPLAARYAMQRHRSRSKK